MVRAARYSLAPAIPNDPGKRSADPDATSVEVLKEIWKRTLGLVRRVFDGSERANRFSLLIYDTSGEHLRDTSGVAAVRAAVSADVMVLVIDATTLRISDNANPPLEDLESATRTKPITHLVSFLRKVETAPRLALLVTKADELKEPRYLIRAEPSNDNQARNEIKRLLREHGTASGETADVDYLISQLDNGQIDRVFFSWVKGFAGENEELSGPNFGPFVAWCLTSVRGGSGVID